MDVNFLSARTFKAHCCTYPIRVFSDQLKELGIKVKFFFKDDHSLDDCDVLCLSMEAFGKRRLNPNPPDRFEFLEYYRPRVKMIIWFDMTDSTGTTQFSVLPYVDLYAKNQLLKDRSLYTKQYYGNRYFTDYYHNLFGIKDKICIDPRSPCPRESIEKLALSWNLGLGDFHTYTKWGKRFRVILPRYNYYKNLTDANTQRDIDITYRVAMNYPLATISYQRKEALTQLSKLAENKEYKVFYEGKIPYAQYMNELRHSRIVPSPFGLGEICFRDFECFLAGATLFKPDKSHLKTWPEFYKPGITYEPYAWNYSDFQEKLIKLLDNPDKCHRIAQAGQARYLESISDKGGEIFAKHFANIIQKAINNSNN